jgi:flagellin-like protein
MKGVSEIISIILIVMIVVSLAGLTWTWYTGIIGTVTMANTNATSTATTALGTQMRIEAAKYTAGYVNATMRNTGTVDIDLSKLGTYVDGSLSYPYTPNTSKLSPGYTVNIRITNKTLACDNKILKITLDSGYEDYRTISC